MPRVAIAGSYGHTAVACSGFCQETGNLFSILAVPLPLPPAFAVLTVLYSRFSDRRVVIAHCGLNLHLPNG